MKVLIQVTQDDIDKGEPECVSICPIALAVERAVGPCDELFVTTGSIRYRQENVVWVAQMNDDGYAFIKRFDTNLIVEPFEFEANFEVYKRFDDEVH